MTEIVALMQEAGDDLFAGMVKSLEDDLAGFRALVNGGAAADGTTVMRSAHSLKGASRSLGAQALGDFCAELERLAKSGEISEIQRRLADNQTLAEHSLNALRDAASAAAGSGH